MFILIKRKTIIHYTITIVHYTFLEIVKNNHIRNMI